MSDYSEGTKVEWNWGNGTGTGEIKRIEHIQNAKLVLGVIERFPHLLYISRSRMESIAKKYSLCIGRPQNYTGPIPVENQKEIALFTRRLGVTPHLGVVATKEQMKLGTYEEFQGSYIVDKDPIVFWKWRNDDWFIVSMWGEEAEIMRKEYNGK